MVFDPVLIYFSGNPTLTRARAIPFSQNCPRSWKKLYPGQREQARTHAPEGGAIGAVTPFSRCIAAVGW